MLSLKAGTPIAIINNNPKKKIFYKEASKDEEPELDTTTEQKTKIFKKCLQRDKKLKKTEIDELVRNYNSGITELDDRTKNRHLQNGIDYVNKSLKRFLDFGKDTEIFPIITEDSYRMLITGGSGSGKTQFMSEFLKVNKVKKGAGVFMFSPFEDDVSIKLKNMIYIKLENYEKDYDKPFELEDIPRGSVCCFDDVDTYNKNYRQYYLELRDTLMERGRHLDISSINIQPNPLQGVKGKIVLRESMYYVVFGKYNMRDTRVLLSTYTGMTKDQIDELLDTDSRWQFVKKSVPSYYITKSEVGLI